MLEIKDNDNIIFEINNYSGRLGNQIGYIARSIYLAKVYRVHSIKLPKTLLTENLNIIMNETNKKNKKVIKIKKGGKYDIDKLFKNIDKNYPDIKYNRKIIKECFQKKFIPHIKQDLYNSSDKNKLYIHIRSGDRIKSVSNCVQPPLDYFVHIIEKKEYEKIHMVYEDTDNPCVNELKKKYENRITSQSSSLLEDLKLF